MRARPAGRPRTFTPSNPFFLFFFHLSPYCEEEEESLHKFHFQFRSLCLPLPGILSSLCDGRTFILEYIYIFLLLPCRHDLSDFMLRLLPSLQCIEFRLSLSLGFISRIPSERTNDILNFFFNANFSRGFELSRRNFIGNTFFQ